MPSVIAFNTGRWYTDKGQRIAATRLRDGILFLDVDRGVDGFIACPHGALDKGTVMAAYDYNLYRGRDYEPDTLAALKILSRAAGAVEVAHA